MSASLSLATRALRGFLWNGSASLIQLGVMLALYALLPLEDLGHFEWALALVMLLSLVGDLGLGAALIQLPDARRRTLRHGLLDLFELGTPAHCCGHRRIFLAGPFFRGRRLRRPSVAS